MSAGPNGFRDPFKPSGFLEGSENTSTDSEITSSPETSPLLGFEKIPRVLIRRLNLKSYINKYDSSHKRISTTSDETCYNGQRDETAQLLYNCSVRLVRDKLEQLKQDILENSRINKIKYNGNLNTMLHCKICEKAYSSEKKLQNHQENKHMLVYKAKHNKPRKRVSFSDHIIVHELKEYHRCRKCPKIFEDYKSLKVHMKQKHKKRKSYICHYCSKNFVDRMFFKVHIKLHCDVCGILLENKSKYLDHRRQSCRVPKRYKCKTCHNMFFNYMDLKDHGYDHLEQLFVCDVCKEQMNSKCSIAHHISYLHSEKRPRALYSVKVIGNVKLYLCNFCNTSSSNKGAIEQHISVLPSLIDRARTGYKDHYFCNQCSQKFDTETGMLQHKWSHFLNTNTQDSARVERTESKKLTFDVKKTYLVSEKLPDFMQPTIVLERLNVDEHRKKEDDKKCDNKSNVVLSNKQKTAKPRPKKTTVTQHICEMCDKSFVTNYNLTRHIVTVHSDYTNLRCKHCEETFVWPSLLKSHRCIRVKIPEMPFDDARPEIQFDGYADFGQSGFDELMNISDSDDYMKTVDFDIPAPTLNQYNGNFATPIHNACRVLIQEVPIEF